MTWNLLKLLRNSKSRRPASRQAHLQIEEMEPRLVLSASTVPWNGGNWFLTGVNLPVTYANWGPGGAGYGSDFGPKYSGEAYYQAVNQEFSNLHTQGVNTVRWWMFQAEDQWLFQGGQVQPGAVTPSFYQNLDRLLTIAANNQVYVDLTVMDARVLDNALGAGEGGHANLATDLNGAGQSFLDNALEPLLQHIATDPAAAPYRSYVLSYDVMNEPELGMRPNTGRAGVYGWGNSNADPNFAQMQSFISRMISDVHQYGGGALATVGSGTVQDTGLWSGMAADGSDRPDFFCAHYYPDASENVAGAGLVAASSLVDVSGKALDRPVVGYECVAHVGRGAYRLDLGVVDPRAPGRFVLGIEFDGPSYNQAGTARDRDRLRGEVLKQLGWKLHRIWSPDWLYRRGEVAQRLARALAADAGLPGAG